LIQKHNAVRVALADTLKDQVSEEYGIDRTSLDDPERKEKPLLNMPVDPKDGYTKMVTEFMLKEFRNKHGLQPDSLFWSDHGFTGVFKNRGFDGEPSNMTLYDVVYWTPRALAILKGSTNRAVASDFWVQKTFDKAEKALSLNPDRIVVVTDVRYKSELAQFKEKFGDQVVFVRINRHKESPSADPSERDLDNSEFDFYVDNTGGIPYLQGQIEGILAKL